MPLPFPICLVRARRQAVSLTLTAMLTVPLAVLGGCGAQPVVEVVPAKGVVKVKGQPVGGILVRIVPQSKSVEGAISSTGVTNESGEFELTAEDGRPGAIPGLSNALLTDTREERPAQGEAAPAPRIAPAYSVLDGRSLAVEIPRTGEPIMIDIP